MLISCNKIKCQYSDKLLLDGIDLSIDNNDKIGLIGVNGTGKSTLLSIIAGTKEAEYGEYLTFGDVKISYLPQTPEFDNNITINEYLRIVIKDNETTLHEAKKVLTKLEISNFDMRISELSGGMKRKLALGAALSKPCDLLILDEPTNHLDCDVIEWLEKYLSRFNKAILMVTHDRYFLEKVANKIIELDRGKLYTYEANYSKYLEIKALREDDNLSHARKLNSFLKKEYEWIKRGAQARSTKDKKRVEKYETLTLASQEMKKGSKELTLESTYSRLGNKTIIFDNVKMMYDKVLFDNVSFNLDKNARIGLIGKNGTGKSTMLDLISGITSPTSGTIEIGQTIKIGYFRQNNDVLDPNIRAIDYINDISPMVKTKKGTISASVMLENFLFEPYTYISKLSGGEKRRLILLGVLMASPNCLLFDEPTNDLDITTLAILEDYLQDFAGIVIVASHDRFLLDKVVNEIFLIKDGSFYKYNGNYSDYLEKSKSDNKSIIYKEDKKRNSDDKPKKIKLTYSEEKELSTIDNEIASLEEDINKIDEKINELYSDYDKCKDYLETKKDLEEKLEYKMSRWEYLNNKLIESGKS